MSQASSVHYLGERKISSLLFRFSIPCVMGLLISALYNIVDQIFIGNSELGIAILLPLIMESAHPGSGIESLFQRNWAFPSTTRK